MASIRSPSNYTCIYSLPLVLASTDNNTKITDDTTSEQRDQVTSMLEREPDKNRSADKAKGHCRYSRYTFEFHRIVCRGRYPFRVGLCTCGGRDAFDCQSADLGFGCGYGSRYGGNGD